jgi:hypothetical protein
MGSSRIGGSGIEGLGTGGSTTGGWGAGGSITGGLGAGGRRRLDGGLLLFHILLRAGRKLRLRVRQYAGETLLLRFRLRLNDFVAAVMKLDFVCFFAAGFLALRGLRLFAGTLRTRIIKLVVRPRRLRGWLCAIRISRIGVHYQEPPFPAVSNLCICRI